MVSFFLLHHLPLITLGLIGVVGVDGSARYCPREWSDDFYHFICFFLKIIEPHIPKSSKYLDSHNTTLFVKCYFRVFANDRKNGRRNYLENLLP